MSSLSLNDIRARAIAFSKEWADAHSEAAEAKLFWRDFLEVFGVNVRRVGFFERKVKKLNDRTGFIDLLWPGVVLVEHKSKGKDLDSAFQQAHAYAERLEANELPKAILVSDFVRIRFYDLEDESNQFEFNVSDLSEHIKSLSFLAGYERRTVRAQDPVDIEAAELMGKLHDRLEAVGYTGHDLELYLVRLLFCLFAEDTGIFEQGLFTEFIETRTAEDGSDLGARLSELFEVLNQIESGRLKTLDEQVAAFPYVNGKLFAHRIRPMAFDREMRNMLLKAAGLNWSGISPAIFGSLFQSILDKQKRRNLGAHYTSEQNILKVINSLFMDDLREKFSAVKSDYKRLLAFHSNLGTLRFFDPACGCGNFLVVAYRELRALELEVITTLHHLRSLRRDSQHDAALLVEGHLSFHMHQFYGIELEDFPAQIAQVAMWLVDHQMNMKLSSMVGQPIANIPLKDAATIVRDNALVVNWPGFVDAEKASQVFIFGNPPFIGSKQLSPEQKADIQRTFGGSRNAGILDYVTCWYAKAMDYIEAVGPNKVRCAFVSTSSITQGEQVSALWGPLLAKGIRINFAHRTFHWCNEGRNNAAVHCVIVGFSKQGAGPRELFDYSNPKGEPHRVLAKNINPYLLDFDDILIPNLSAPICAVPALSVGNQPIDNGEYLFTEEEKAAFLAIEPGAEKYFRPWIGADEFLYSYTRWCLWLGDAEPNDLRKLSAVTERVERVRKFRAASKRAQTQAIAAKPRNFFIENMPKDRFLLIPEVSSERRPYLPIGFIDDGGYTLCSNLVKLAPGAQLYHFGVLTSAMHMAWMRTVCGRLESRYRYSTGVVYNTFPWPSSPTSKQVQAVEVAAKGVLDARKAHPSATLADLYDPNTMPADLAEAHARLDRAVDAAYLVDGGSKSWADDLDRAKFLFGRFKTLTEGSLIPTAEPNPKRTSATTKGKKGAK